MSAADLVQYVVTGLLVGGVYALMSIGLALIFGVMRVVNFAQGDFMMLGMYLAYYFAIGHRIDPLLGALLATPPFFVLGLLVHRGLLARVTGGGDPQRQLDATLILTLGLSLIITNATTMILSPMPRAIRTGYATEAFVVGPILINQARAYAFAMAVLLAGLVYAFLTRTDLGKALRAAADEPEAAGYQGIDVRAMHGVAFGIGVALVAAAGGLLATYHPIEPTVAVNFIVLMFVAVVLGGLGSIP
ncbi:MAG TPA: branched-chain amino acid ABC transporter permease, partial [Methylomirabilota bacterium]